MIRRRRGLSQDVVAGLAGISKPYLSALERGQRGFNRRGLIEDLAQALGCSVADLTGQPYHLPDRQSTDVDVAVAQISTALHDTTLEDVPDVPVRPLSDLAQASDLAHAQIDDAQYGMAARGLADLLIGLHVWVVTGSSGERMAALARLAEACKVAYVLAKRPGQIELAGIAAQRGLDAARLAERLDLVGDAGDEPDQHPERARGPAPGRRGVRPDAPGTLEAAWADARRYEDRRGVRDAAPDHRIDRGS